MKGFSLFVQKFYNYVSSKTGKTRQICYNILYYNSDEEKYL